MVLGNDDCQCLNVMLDNLVDWLFMYDCVEVVCVVGCVGLVQMLVFDQLECLFVDDELYGWLIGLVIDELLCFLVGYIVMCEFLLVIKFFMVNIGVVFMLGMCFFFGYIEWYQIVDDMILLGVVLVVDCFFEFILCCCIEDGFVSVSLQYCDVMIFFNGLCLEFLQQLMFKFMFFGNGGLNLVVIDLVLICVGGWCSGGELNLNL